MCWFNTRKWRCLKPYFSALPRNGSICVPALIKKINLYWLRKTTKFHPEHQKSKLSLLLRNASWSMFFIWKALAAFMTKIKRDYLSNSSSFSKKKNIFVYPSYDRIRVGFISPRASFAQAGLKLLGRWICQKNIELSERLSGRPRKILERSERFVKKEPWAERQLIARSPLAHA